jgi:hypothetical protein
MPYLPESRQYRNFAASNFRGSGSFSKCSKTFSSSERFSPAIFNDFSRLLSQDQKKKAEQIMHRNGFNFIVLIFLVVYYFLVSWLTHTS